MRSAPVWVWVLAFVGTVTLVQGWLLRRPARLWVICPHVDAGAAGTEPLELVVRRVWRELSPRDRVVVVASEFWPDEVRRGVTLLRRRFPFSIATTMPAEGTRDVVILRPYLAAPSA